MNTYQLAGHRKTTGWIPQENDVNGVNSYGMRPVEVAAQAGDLKEFREIIAHPDFDPKGARVRYFANVLRDYRGEREDVLAYYQLLPLVATVEQMAVVKVDELNGFKAEQRISAQDVQDSPPQVYTGTIESVWSDATAYVRWDYNLNFTAERHLVRNGRVELHNLRRMS
jgi:hypothetical protein